MYNAQTHILMHKRVQTLLKNLDFFTEIFYQRVLENRTQGLKIGLKILGRGRMKSTEKEARTTIL